VATPGLLLLLADTRFPSGAHAHSAGAEAAVAAGDVVDAPTLERFLRGRLATTGAVDAAFAAAACRVALEGDRVAPRLGELDREYEARVLSPRLREVSRQLGRQLLRTVRAGWSAPALDAVARPDGAHQPLVWGVAVAVAGGEPADAAGLVLHHLCGAVTSSVVRLLALDPFEVVGVQVAVAPIVADLAADAVSAASGPVADLPAWGGALAEILGEHHGTWTNRLFVG
jgi:urease accessory protein